MQIVCPWKTCSWYGIIFFHIIRHQLCRIVTKCSTCVKQGEHVSSPCVLPVVALLSLSSVLIANVVSRTNDIFNSSLSLHNMTWSKIYFFVWFGWLIVLNASFNNCSVISWWSHVLVEKTRVAGENYRPVASHRLTTISHNVVSSILVPYMTNVIG